MEQCRTGWVFHGLVIVWLVWCSTARAAARSEASCDVYTHLDDLCRCPGETNYLRSYGFKYCERLRQSTGWSPKGIIWRDATLLCLQTRIRAIVRDEQTACDCHSILERAFESHVDCYTQPGESFCALPLTDIDKIYSIVDSGDLWSRAGLHQTLGVLFRCLGGDPAPRR